MIALLPLIVIAGAALLDYLFARAWMPAYFRYGIPLLRMRVHGVRLDLAAEERLQSVAERNASKILFQRLSEGEIAFREKGNANPAFRYIPVLRGLLRYVPEEGATYVIGWLNFFAIGAVAVFAYIFFTSPSFRRPWDLIAFAVLIFGTMVGIGVWRYRMVAKALRA